MLGATLFVTVVLDRVVALLIITVAIIAVIARAIVLGATIFLKLGLAVDKEVVDIIDGGGQRRTTTDLLLT